MSRLPEINQQRISTLVSLLRHRAEYQADQKAYTYLENGEADTSVITFAALDQRARSIATHLQQHTQRGARVLLLYPSGLDFITAFFGCLYAGIVAIPVNLPRPNRPLTRLNAIVTDAQVTHVLTTTAIQPTIHSACVSMPIMRGLDWICTDNVMESRNWQPPQVTGDTLAYLQYTSGSTATPKGVMVSHANLLQNMAILDHGWNHTPASTLISWLPHFHDMGLIYGVLQPLYNGIPCVLLSPVHFLQKPVRWLQAITRFQGTHSAAPNFAYDLCVDKISPDQRQTLDLRSWRVALNGAEPVRKATLERFIKVFAPYGLQEHTLCPGYGLAEGTLKVAATPEHEPFMFCTVEAAALEQNKVAESSGDHTYTLVSSGRTALDTNIVIVHPQHQTRCANDEVGEIWVAGSSVAQGYWQRPTETAETFQAYLQDTGEGPFLRTGDLGFLHNDHVFVTGRLKDVIIIRGRNHYPQDIEHTTEQSHIAIRPGCSAAFSIDNDGTEELVIICEIEREHRRANLADVVETILQVVSEQHDLSVHAIVLIRPGTIPKTSSGKIQRRACRTLFSEDGFQVLHRWTQTDVQDTGKALTGDKPLPSATQHLDRAVVQKWLIERFAAHLHQQPTAIDPHASIDQLRLNSLTAINIIGELGDWFGRDLSPTLFYNYQTIAALADHLTQDGLHHPPQTQITEKQPHNEPIAIVGVGCRFPGAENIEAFWDLLIQGTSAIREVPAQRWNADQFYDPTPAIKGKMNTRWGGFLEHIDTFDAPFFGISPREAACMDPQQRLLLEVAWEALEHGGLTSDQLTGTNTGVFVGISTNEYQRLQFSHPDSIDAYAGTGTALSIAANRLSYLLNLNGPSMAIDTACSSSLVAVHLACQSLRQRECDTAIAGGSNVILGPETSIALAQAQMLSPSGQCKTFDANADGYVRGEGCGVVVLKRLSDARAAKDRVLAVIRGSAINQDGRSNGLSAPNGMAQQAVIRQALQAAHIVPANISYVETHGTGTSLGDPIEVEALVHILQEERDSSQPCVLGSVKTNIGHLEAGAGIAGLIKTALAMWHGTIPPHLHLETLNPYIQLEHTPFLINTQPYEWPRNGQPRYAGVSSFGFGGTNAHIIVEDAPVAESKAAIPQKTKQRSSHLLTLSARSETALTALADRYAQHIAAHSDNSLEDICYTANIGRTHFPHRLATVANTSEQLRKQLQAFASGKRPQYMQVQQTPSAPQSIIWLFSGQGSQYLQMGRILYETQPTFRTTLDRCADILAAYLDIPLLDLLYSDAVNETLIHETAYTQPILFAFEYALAEMWRSWGIVPTAVMGHSVGEYVAACVAGVFSLEDGLRLIAERGRLMQNLPKNGKMAVIFADETFVRSAIEPYSATVAIAAINGPTNVTISGEHDTIEALVRQFEAEGVTTRPLATSHAFHSPLMNPITDAFEEAAKQIQFDSPRIPLVSNLTGTFFEAGYIPDSTYWRKHIRAAVRFADGVHALQTLEQPLFIELGPTSSLMSMGKRCADGPGTWLTTLKQKQDDWHILLQTLGKLYVNGISIDWEQIAEGYPHYQRIHLPTYPFERTSYWFKTPEHQTLPTPPVNGKTHSVEVYTKGDHTFMEEVVQRHSSTSYGTVAPVSRLDTIRITVRSMLTRLLEMDQEALDAHASFLDIGADSIVLIHAIQSIQSTFGIDISVRQMFEGLNTLEAVAVYLDQQLPADAYIGATVETHTSDAAEIAESATPSGHTASVTPMPALREHPNRQSGELERIMTQQLASMSSIITQQLEVLQIHSTTAQAGTTNGSHKNGSQHVDATHNGKKVEKHTPSVKSEPEAFVPYKAIDPGTTSELTPQQQTYLDTFIESYTARTTASKQQAQHDQQYHADLRNTMHFHLTTKELCYPLVATHALGSKMWDIDGNEYVDLTMGFGVNFFGHQEPFILEALQAQLQQGIHVGPQSQLAGEVAKLMCELTGAERVTFCNSGSEAVMTALRLARAATGRHKIAIFAGSYHGTFDGILATSQLVDGQPHTIPMAPGVTPHMVEDTIVIPFDSPHALKVLREHQHELAAVLVEPVQSRRPDLQPKAFLQEVRALTQAAGIALIFDEVITGFRVHPGGAQAWYGIQADLATYGKVIGGGMPIGAVAGKAAFMNTVDGGEWSFQDQSYPRSHTTFYSGTFCKHPLAMAAGRAVLQRIKDSGPQLQEELNERVAQLAQTLNTYFEHEQVPVSVIHFGSLFRFAFAPQLTFSQVVNLWFYHLVEKGIYIWEGRNCIVSTAHTDRDFAHIIDAVKQSVVELRAGGFLPNIPSDSGPDRGSGASSKTIGITTIPLTEAQHQLVMLTQMGGSALELVALRFRGSFDVDVLQKVIQEATNRHEALRVVIDHDYEHQHILPYQKVAIPIIDTSHTTEVDQDHQIDEWLDTESQHQFNLTQGPLVRWHVLKRSPEDYMLVLTAHHIVLDGWSIVVLL
ncbi:MAG: aminotransferase class III-fold pyridoxal phosphate-dependent enzyme, partial [Chloroflexota bacterium]